MVPTREKVQRRKIGKILPKLVFPWEAGNPWSFLFDQFFGGKERGREILNFTKLFVSNKRDQNRLKNNFENFG